MNQKRSMDRRRFLSTSTSLLLGSVFALSPFRRAFAQGVRHYYQQQARFALIIDDIGYSVHHARQFLSMGLPLTFSILPRLRHSTDLAMEIRSLGHEIMLHQPMEPYNPSIDPGPGALYVSDGADVIDRIVEENIFEFPYALGVNNHMGSRFTEHPRGIAEALRVIKRNRLFFIDSLTTNRSVAFSTARRLHMPSAARNFFVDFRQEKPAVIRQLRRLVRHAIRYGSAIGIGHPYPETAEAIARFSGDLEHCEARMVPISNIVQPSA